MKKRFPLYLVFFLLTGFIIIPSCRKVNEATLLGGGLVPEVDNINTFEAFFETSTDNALLTDTGRLAYSDPVALGAINNDPEFGQTTASVYFQVIPLTYGKNAFSVESPIIDSVILSLDYLGGYGNLDALQTVRVYEIAQNPAFNDTTYFQFSGNDFETTGSELGSRTFSLNSLKDSVPVRSEDTTIKKVASQLRIRLDDAFGARLATYDSTTGYKNDTAFKELFRGFALKADEGTGSGLGFFQLSNTTKTTLTVYYRAQKTDGTFDTAETVFRHALREVRPNVTSTGGQANIIKRQPAGNWAAYLENGQTEDDKLYIQSSPAGSLAFITIKGLDTFSNKLVHRAELVATRIPSTLDDLLHAPDQLFLDRITQDNGADSAFLFPEFLAPTGTGGVRYDLDAFGGHLRGDNTYRINITKIVQDVFADRAANPTLRLYAPFDTQPYDPSQSPKQRTFIQTVPYPAFGRVVLGGGNYAEEGKRLRLRVVYSNL